MRALLLVDLQNDFLPGGVLAVPDGDQVIPIANQLVNRFSLVVATQDWHPADHRSFASQHPGRKPGDMIDLGGIRQTLWPDHCIQHSYGAAFAPAFNQPEHVFRKGTNRELDSYSGFYDNNHINATGLGDFLKQRAVNEVFILGLALDYCVKFTALDAVRQGFKTQVVLDGCRAVNLNPDDGTKAIAALQQVGVTIIQSTDL